MTTRKVGFVGLMIVVMPALLLGVLSDPSNQRSALPGCYRVQLGKWSGQFPSGLWVEHTPPLVFKLDTVNLAPPFDNSGLKRVMPATLIVPRGSFPAGWRVVRLDTIMVRWSTGFAGVRLRLKQRGDTLVEYAQSFYDVVGPKEPTASVTAIKTTCPTDL